MKTKVPMVKTARYSGGGLGFAQFLVQPFYNAWQYRELIRVIVWRELTQRFRDSYMGWAWAVIAPIVMLAVYVSIFSNAFHITTTAIGSLRSFALSTFIALIIFNLYAELVSRAPQLLLEHVNYIKKSIFPSEVLAWTSLLRSLVYAGIGLIIFLIFEIFMTGSPPMSALLFPFIFLPFCLFTLGSIWLLASLGAFTRDISYLIATVIPVLIFASPVFYTTLDFSLAGRLASYLNPLTPFIEMAREIFLIGKPPDPLAYAISWLVSAVVFYGGYGFFMRYRSVVVDVL
jgi:lipopolysaccharide transport system permease protein